MPYFGNPLYIFLPASCRLPARPSHGLWCASGFCLGLLGGWRLAGPRLVSSAVPFSPLLVSCSSVLSACASGACSRRSAASMSAKLRIIDSLASKRRCDRVLACRPHLFNVTL